jgi:transcriptional regulator with XRE-family HTH domain
VSHPFGDVVELLRAKFLAKLYQTSPVFAKLCVKFGEIASTYTSDTVKLEVILVRLCAAQTQVTLCTVGDIALGERIAAARKRAGYTQITLATAVGTSRTSVSNWENGVHAPRSKEMEVLRGLIDLDGTAEVEDSNPDVSNLEALSSAELVSLLHRIAAEVARRLGDAGKHQPGAEEVIQASPGARRLQVPATDAANKRRSGPDRTLRADGR